MANGSEKVLASKMLSLPKQGEDEQPKLGWVVAKWHTAQGECRPLPSPPEQGEKMRSLNATVPTPQRVEGTYDR